MRHLTQKCFAPSRAMLALALLLAGLANAQTTLSQPAVGASDMQAASMPPAPFYTVVNLGEGFVQRTAINRYGQVAYSIDRSGYFYDGSRIFKIPGIAGASLSLADNLNDKGQVVGGAGVDNTDDIHPFVWSKRTGIRDLRPLDNAAVAEARDINNHGIAVGYSWRNRNSGVPIATLWRGPGHRFELGAPGPGLSFAVAINDAGLVAGNFEVAPGTSHAFAWARATGFIDIGTLPGGTGSDARAVDEFGEIAGNSGTASGNDHAYLWTRATGIRDLGTAGGDRSLVLGMSSLGRIAGEIFTSGGEHAMTWTHATGMKDIGTLPGGVNARAWAANNYGQVVGDSNLNGQAQAPLHAFIWTAATGMIDLNTRVRHLPNGMLLQSARAISDNGSIVVLTNTGLVLLKPGRCGCGAAVGPITAPDSVAAGTPYFVSTHLVDDDAAAVHSVSWSWGDGSTEPASRAIERGGEGIVNASHVYSTPGTYQVTARVTDDAGHTTTVTRKVVVKGPA